MGRAGQLVFLSRRHRRRELAWAALVLNDLGTEAGPDSEVSCLLKQVRRMVVLGAGLHLSTNTGCRMILTLSIRCNKACYTLHYFDIILTMRP